MFQQVLVVCVGNICRSPMAEILLVNRFHDSGLRISSAGLNALVGNPADPLAVELLHERGLDLTQHRARQITQEMVLESDLVLVMDREQQRSIEAMLPSARGRVHRMGRWSGFDVPDPYQQGRAVFEEALGLLERGIEDFHRVISPATASSGLRKVDQC